ncbi:MAG: hypothetical protein H9855_17670 [Candidatus Acinetobacter avistercoris]|uniref:hypothetical protein n=1 Tax=Acinetobacter sp. KS-LM10 TaxID=3120518 RepID=UPI001F900009|nr:hypothetical protein [Candidatus Acinetobacter avistercoris]
MLKIALTALMLTIFSGCAMTSMSYEEEREISRKQMMRHNMSNMSHFDIQKYYADHNLGPVPVKPVNKPRRD